MRSLVIPALVLSAAAFAAVGDARAEEKTVATVNDTSISHDELVEELLIRHGESVLEDMVLRKGTSHNGVQTGINPGTRAHVQGFPSGLWRPEPPHLAFPDARAL